MKVFLSTSSRLARRAYAAAKLCVWIWDSISLVACSGVAAERRTWRSTPPDSNHAITMSTTVIAARTNGRTRFISGPPGSMRLAFQALGREGELLCVPGHDKESAAPTKSLECCWPAAASPKAVLQARLALHPKE